MNIRELDLNEMSVVAGGGFWSKTVSIGWAFIKVAWVVGFLHMAKRRFEPSGGVLSEGLVSKNKSENRVVCLMFVCDYYGIGYAALGMVPLAHWCVKGIYNDSLG